MRGIIQADRSHDRSQRITLQSLPISCTKIILKTLREPQFQLLSTLNSWGRTEARESGYEDPAVRDGDAIGPGPRSLGMDHLFQPLISMH